MSPADEILTQRRGAVLWITFNRPQARNAMTFGMYDRLLELSAEIEADRELRAAVLTGAGEKAFVSGTDISQFEKFEGSDDALAYEERIDGVMKAIERIRVPTIAAVRGACTGAGMSIAGACDLRIATADSRFGFPVARTLGNCLSIANVARVVDLVGPAAVKQIVYTASLIDAPRAHELGFLNEVVADPGNLLTRAGELAEQIAGNAPLTIAATKEALRRIAYEGRNANGSDLILSCYLSNDFREGMKAFFEKRKARWTGT